MIIAHMEINYDGGIFHANIGTVSVANIGV